MEKQLELARDVREQLLPGKTPHLLGYDIAAISIPANQLGGDYFDYLPTQQGHLGLAVADVSGHGIASALAMTAFRTLLRMQTRCQETLQNLARLKVVHQQNTEINDGLQKVKREMIRDYNDCQQSVRFSLFNLVEGTKSRFNSSLILLMNISSSIERRIT